MELPTIDSEISREIVESVLREWKDNRLSSERLYAWVEGNFFPAGQTIAPGEAEHTRLALSLVLNEFDCTRPDGYRREGANSAIDLINATKGDFRAHFIQFLTQCFVEKSVMPDDIDRYIEQHRRVLIDD